MIGLLTINYIFMAFGKKFKRFAGSLGKSVGDLTGSEAIGRATAMATGFALGIPAGGIFTAIPGAMGGSSGYSMVEREQTRAKNAMAQNERNQAIQQAQQAQIAEQSRLRLLAEEDIKRQQEEEKKRTTFAGASMQNISERKRLLGV